MKKAASDSVILSNDACAVGDLCIREALRNEAHYDQTTTSMK